MEILEFSWLPALAGGIMIGTASALLMAFNGRVAGISGILGGLLSRWSPDQWWRLTFLLGLVLGGGAAFYWAPETFIDITENGTMQVLAAGLLVGLGTRIGSGCTSGHGVCGIGRLSIRSLVATLVFVGSGMLTVFFSGGLQ